MPSKRRFKQVDVFSRDPFKGNPLAVVLDADGMTDAQMQAAARWTNLSETTFVLPASDPAADYRVRIFTPDTEFPFAGHPTLGTAHALLEAGLKPKTPGRLLQQCGVGLVPLELAADGALAFRAPPAQLSVFDEALRALLGQTLQSEALAAELAPVAVDMGIKWLVARLSSAEQCLALRPAAAALADLCARCGVDGLAVYGPHPAQGPADYEVRAFCLTHGALTEDPVTGSANACIARAMQAQGCPDGADSAAGYTARQGTVLGCDGRISVTFRDGEAWIGGHSVTVIDGAMLA